MFDNYARSRCRVEFDRDLDARREPFDKRKCSSNKRISGDHRVGHRHLKEQAWHAYRVRLDFFLTFGIDSSAVAEMRCHPGVFLRFIVDQSLSQRFPRLGQAPDLVRLTEQASRRFVHRAQWAVLFITVIIVGALVDTVASPLFRDENSARLTTKVLPVVVVHCEIIVQMNELNEKSTNAWVRADVRIECLQQRYFGTKEDLQRWRGGGDQIGSFGRFIDGDLSIASPEGQLVGPMSGIFLYFEHAQWQEITRPDRGGIITDRPRTGHIRWLRLASEEI